MGRMSHAELVDAGMIIASSEMFGKINPSSGYMIAAICDQKGISYLDFSETYNWMHGAPTMKADAMLAKFVEQGGKFKFLCRTPEKAEIEVEYGDSKKSFSLTWDEIKDEPFTKTFKGDTKSNYATPRKRMQSMSSRVVSDAVHTTCPQACKGMYTTEEAETFINDDERPAVRGGEPVALGKVDAVARAKAVQAVTETFAPSEIVPEGFGAYTGKRWGDLDTDLLDKALKSPKLSDDHKFAITGVIAKRGGV